MNRVLISSVSIKEESVVFRVHTLMSDNPLSPQRSCFVTKPKSELIGVSSKDIMGFKGKSLPGKIIYVDKFISEVTDRDVFNLSKRFGDDDQLTITTAVRKEDGEAGYLHRAWRYTTNQEATDRPLPRDEYKTSQEVMNHEDWEEALGVSIARPGDSAVVELEQDEKKVNLV